MYLRRSFFYNILALTLVGLLFVVSYFFVNPSFTTTAKEPTETTPITLHSEPKTHQAVPSKTVSTIASTYKTSLQVTQANTASRQATHTAPNQVTSTNYINISGRNIPIVYSNNTMQDSGTSAALYKTGKFIYGHNTAPVFASLPYLSIGDTITISLNGNTSTYRVAFKVTMTKENTQKFMNAIANARINGSQYDFAIMTCAGTSYGNGDATERTTIFVSR